MNPNIDTTLEIQEINGELFVGDYCLGNDDPITRVDAQLFAHAAEMLAVLRDIASGNHWLGECQKRARAAIARAEHNKGAQ